MTDTVRQLDEHGGDPSVNWSMTGGNNALFGDVVRACIYQPQPGGWGLTWDEDPDREGEYKKSIEKSGKYVDTEMAREYTKYLRDVTRD